MKPISLKVRCMAWQEQDMWVAACIDLTLAAQGATLDAAKARLHEQIGVYVNEAVGVDAEHAEALLERRAPLHDRMRYVFWRAVAQRPRLRRTAGKLARAIGLAVGLKRPYIEPLPLHA